MTIRFVFKLVILTLVYTSGPGVIAQSSATAENVELAVVEINPNTSATTSLNFTRFDRSEFLGKYTSTSDFLQQNAGIQVRYHGLGSQAILSVRGSTHDQIRFMVDGQFVENPQYGGFDVDQIPLSQIESIELIKGSAPGSSQQAIGGVIKITRIKSSEANTIIQGSIGEYAYRQFGIHHNRNFFGDLSFGLDFSKASYDYNTNITSPLSSPNERNQITPLNNNQQNKHYTQLNWQSNYTNIGQFNLLLEHRLRKKHIPNYFHNSHLNNTYYQKSHNTLGIGYEYISPNQIQLNTDISFETHNDRYQDPKGMLSFYPQNIRYKYYQTQLNQQFSQQLDHYHWRANASFVSHSYEDDHTLTEDSAKCTAMFAACDLSSQRQQALVTTEHGFDLRSLGLITISGGYDYNSYHVEERISGANKRNSHSELTQWSIAYHTSLTNNLKTSLSVNKANRLPNLMELYGDLGAVKGNQSLAAEKAINYSFDINWMEAFQTAAFYRNITDRITILYDFQGIGSYDNTQQAEIAGFELQANWLWKAVSIHAAYLSQNSLTHSNTKSFDQQKLPGIYHKSATLSLSYQISAKHSLSLQNHLDEDLYLDASNLLEGSTRRVSHLSYQFQDHSLLLKLTAKNILDYQYFDQSNHQAAGRNLLLQTTYSF